MSKKIILLLITFTIMLFSCSEEKKDECSLGEIRCSSDNYGIETCDSEGNWVLTECTDSQVCVGENESTKCEVESKCNENDKRCDSDNSGIETCDSEGNWVLTECTDSQVCVGENESTKCEVQSKCNENDKRCDSDNSGIETCDSEGNWVLTECIDSKVCMGENDGTKCEEPASDCIGLSFDTITHRDASNEYIGESGGYKLIVAFYEDEAPMGEYDLGVEVNDNYYHCKQCVNIVNNGTDYFQESGKIKIVQGEGKRGFSKGEVLSAKLVEVTIDDLTKISTPVVNGQCIEIETGKSWSWDELCTTGTSMCNSDKTLYRSCNANREWVETTCGDNQVCDTSNGVSSCLDKVCSEDEKRCNGDNVERCNDSGLGWSTALFCIGGKVCQDDYTCGEPPCISDEKRCNLDNTGVETCVNGVWQVATCGDGESCSGNGDTTVCESQVVGEWIKITTGGYQTCGIKDILGVKKSYCWGAGTYGRLGTNSITTRLLPTELAITENSSWSDISTNKFHSCGIKSNKLYCWGKNNKGQIGGTNTENRLSPELVNSDTNWRDVEVGGDSTCAIKTDGALYCWGSNQYGQLGIGNEDDKSIPTQVGTDSNWSSVALGYSHTCAVKTDSKLYCWGRGLTGRLGNGDTDNSNKNTPTLVADNYSIVALGYAHTCGIRTDGKLYCWGKSSYGRLGTSTTEDLNVPTDVAGDNQNWNSISIGYYHSCATKTGGKLYCWGKNDKGQLGLNNNDDKTVPTEVSGDNWSSVMAGANHNCAFKVENSKNKLYCWGRNSKGQLGVGDMDNRLTPTFVE